MDRQTLINLTKSITELDISISAVVLCVSLLGVVILLLSIRRLWQRKVVSACISGSCGLCLLSVALLVLAVAFNIHTYQRLTYEKPLLQLTFEAAGQQHFNVVIADLQSGNQTGYALYGDDWQLDARVLRWEPPLQLLGADAGYRLERISGRYASIEHELERPRSVYSLSESSGLDVWKLARKYQRWFPWLDAYYGSATYLPMRDGARYTVSVSQHGLVARPDNATAEQAVFSWN